KRLQTASRPTPLVARTPYQERVPERVLELKATSYNRPRVEPLDAIRDAPERFVDEKSAGVNVVNPQCEATSVTDGAYASAARDLDCENAETVRGRIGDLSCYPC